MTIDWVSIAGIATAAGTALLAVATFAATRSANRSARSAERALLEGMRPILMPSRWDEAPQKIRFVDGKWLIPKGSRAALEVTPDVIYIAMSVQNAGRGLAVLHGWAFPEHSQADPIAPERFGRLTRDIYIPAGGPGFAQIGVRDPSSPEFERVSSRLGNGESIHIDILYGDAEGTQRIITRFYLTRYPGEHTDPDEWMVVVSRHWNLDLPAPR